MSEIAPASRLENIEKSLNVYFQTELITALGLTVIFPRAERVGVLPNQWIELDYFQLSDQTRVSKSSSGRRGARSHFLINANCYEQDDARLDGSATLYTLTAIVDIVRNKLAPNLTVPVLDYEIGGTPLVGGLTAESFTDVTPVPSVPDAGITQVNVSATMSYIAESID